MRIAGDTQLACLCAAALVMILLATIFDFGPPWSDNGFVNLAGAGALGGITTGIALAANWFLFRRRPSR